MVSALEWKEGVLAEDSRTAVNASIRLMFVMPHISARLSSDRFRPLLVLGAWYLALGAVLRIVLWSSFARVQQVSAEEIGRASCRERV